MKTRLFFTMLFAGMTILPAAAQTDSLGLPGDQFDLCGVLELFKKAQSPEDFEKAINNKDNKVNNLDLDGDGKVDYVRVLDNSKGNAHAMVLQVAVNEKESQDVAVIEIEKSGENSAQLQIIGDEELYGKDYIVEPAKEQAKTTEGKWRGFAPQIVIINVWYWPCVQYIWYPGYVVYVSPWYWGYWPGWWYPWAPYPYYVYYGWWYPYHEYYYWTSDYRMHDAHEVYKPRRTVSPTVQKKYEPAHRQYETKTKDAPPRGGQQPVPGKPPVQPSTNPRSDVPPAPQQPAPSQQNPKGNTPPPAPSQQPQQNPKGGVSPAPPAPTPKPHQNPQPAPKPQPSPQPKKPR